MKRKNKTTKFTEEEDVVQTLGRKATIDCRVLDQDSS